jgi:acyl transferase domain-containing protein/SAM-dependent methyltransferase
MNNEVKTVLELVQKGQISPQEGRKRLGEVAASSPVLESAPTCAPVARHRVETSKEPTAMQPTRKAAVVGLACRFAGAQSPGEFWKNLAAGACSIREVPADRWDANSHYDATPQVPGKTNSKWGGFLADVKSFDPLFFNMSGREAELTDPQQRLFLESAWAALEDAGYCGDAASGLNCGVYAGAPSSEYGTNFEPDAQVMMGNDTALLPARISYFLNLRGPSIAINTACSSSLVAIQLACQAIESGQCDMALAGGVCLFISPDFYVSASQGGMLSPDGLCKTFDAGANGFVPGEGVGILVVKALDAAVRDGDHIYGIVLAADTNQDGKTNGITAPSSKSQTAIQLAVYEKAGISPETISVVEAHGTGTGLGDPIEIEALTRSFSQYTQRKQFCAIGSVKTNIGHTGQAAGVAGVIKMLLAFRHQIVPSSLHFKSENPRINFADTPFFVATQPVPWPRGKAQPRRAAVSSFGYSGTNAHLVLEEPPTCENSPEDLAPRLVLISAKTEAALHQRLDDLARWLDEEGTDVALVDIAFTLHIGRKHFAERVALVVRDKTELLEALRNTRLAKHDRLSPAEKRERATAMRQERSTACSEEFLVQAADLYMRGLDLDVEQFYRDGRGCRISLPTYPFAREQYWIAPKATSSVVVSNAKEPIHPLISAEVSASTGRVFAFRPKGDEFFVTDHVIQGQCILAAAVSLEIGWAAGGMVRSAPTHLRRVTWRRPLIGNRPEGLEIRVEPDGDDLHFEIGTGADKPSVSGIVCYGAPSVAAETIDLVALRARCLDSLSGAECYDRYKLLGFDYGPGFRVIHQLQFNNNEVLAELELPDALVAQSRAFVMHPALLDGAFQSMIALHQYYAPRGGHFVPCELEEVRVTGSIPKSCFAILVRKGNDTVDVCLTDESGRVLVSVRGLFVARVAGDAHECLMFRPIWREVQKAEVVEASGPVLMFDRDADAALSLRSRWQSESVILVTPGPKFARLSSADFQIDPNCPEDYVRLLESLSLNGVPSRILVCWGALSELDFPDSVPDLSRGFHTLLYLSQGLMKSRPSRPVKVSYIYPVKGHLGPPHLVALGAFARTVRLEYPDLRFQTIGLPAGEGRGPIVADYLDDLLSADMNSDAVEIRLGPNGKRWVRELEELAWPHGITSELIRDGGVYLITGGLGALGLAFARHLAQRKAKLILLGRSPISAENEVELARLSEQGAIVSYEKVDIAEHAALEQAITRGRTRFGAIHGVIHSAGCIRDSFIMLKTAESAREVLRAKLNGAIGLDRLTCDDHLDFMVYFSSVVSVTGNVGQADYAFANACLDELATVRESLRSQGKRWGRTLSISWPGWGVDGMQSTANEESLRAKAGLSLLSEHEGLAAFEQLLSSGDRPHLVVAKGDPVATRRLLTTVRTPDPTSSKASTERTEDLLSAAEDYLKAVLAEELRIPVERISASEALEAYGIESVMVMKLSRRLEVDFGELPRTLFFEYQNLRELAAYFAHRHADKLARNLGLIDKPHRTLPTSAETLSEALPCGSSGLSASKKFPQLSPEYHDAIAIIGMSGRYPMAEDLDAFWGNLSRGVDCVTEIPSHRWQLGGFYSPEKGMPGKSYTKWGGFLTDIDKFDPLFFKIAPREADMMDPQERLFLETVWHVTEDAGYPRSKLSGTRVGVYVGVMYGEYQLLTSDGSDGRMGLSSYASIANRASYFFNFRGPSMALDTMCSSSLTAIHLACDAIRRGECDSAIAGGVNLSLHPHKYLQLSLGGFASSDGRCRSFGDGGDGYVPGEGVGAVFLKPLAAAVADGDQIHGLVRGTAINHGGKTNGYTVPNPHAQSGVIAEALRSAGLSAEDVSYVEAHGTGTSLGDPIEIAALTRAYGSLVAGKSACPIGSVKSAIGHLESAAGIAAVTKVLLQMRHKSLAPSLHAEKLNPNIDFNSSPFFVQRELGPWCPRGVRADNSLDRPRIAGVSSFGAGGSNAHAIIQEYGVPLSTLEQPSKQLFVLSAKSTDRLTAIAAYLAEYLDRELSNPSLPSLTWQVRFRDDLLRRVCDLVGVREGEISGEDDLNDCGLDRVLKLKLSADMESTYGFSWDADSYNDTNTVACLSKFLIARFTTQVQRFFLAVDCSVVRPPRLSDVAFTLQLGREEMEERLAFVASDLDDAARKLRAFAAGEKDWGGFAARVPSGSDPSIPLPFAGKAGEVYLQSLIVEKDFPRITQLWVQGAHFDWQLLHSGGDARRISLPGYRFAREKHWLPVTPANDAHQSAELPEAFPPSVISLSQGTESKAPNFQPSALIEQTYEVDMTSSRHATDIASSTLQEARSLLIRDLVNLAAGTIGLAPERLDPKINVGDYGFESLGIKELSSKISSRLGIAVSPTVFFERASLEGVANWLMEEYGTRVATFYSPLPQVQLAESAIVPTNPVANRPILRPEDEAVSASREPIAIVGMSGRFPGSRDLVQFWENLRAERNLVSEIPQDRWDWREYDHEGLPPASRCKSHSGGFLDDVDKFDPLFFGISPAEAEMMDPQQRTFLEAVWTAIEDAGYRPSELSGKNVGLFAGVQFSDYQHLLHEAGLLTAQSALGNEHSIVLNRISYLLNLRGPSEPVNTACSSSLVAVHRAVRSIRSGESSIAIAGGIALNLAPHSTVAAGMMGLLASDGKCKTLDRSANGYVKGEGIGVVVLKPLSRALADGDHIYALIRGSAVNHGGRAASITAPNSEAQAELIQSAIEEANVDANTIGYIELHGTGTELGDPVEINGIKSAFRKLSRKRGTTQPLQPYCGLGSVKTNIGHLEPASGIAGMIKVVLSMNHRVLPRLLHLNELNPYVDLNNSPFYVVDTTRPWNRLVDPEGREVPRRAGVSSFGFGGVNAHLVLEEYVEPKAVMTAAPKDQVFVFSAKTQESLEAVLANFHDRVQLWERDGNAPALSDVAYTLQVGREEMKERAACVARDLRELRGRMEQLVANRASELVFRGQALPGGTLITSADHSEIARNWVCGGVVDWRALYSDVRPHRLSLPTYSFARKKYWFSATEGKELRKSAAIVQPSDPASSEGHSNGQPLSGEEYVREQLRVILAQKLKIAEEELEEDRNLQDFGVDSMLSAMIMQTVQETFGSQVPLTAVIDHPTLRSLGKYIYEESLGGDTSQIPQDVSRPARVAGKPRSAPLKPGTKQVKLPPELLPINLKGTRQASFWVHGAAGYSAWFQNLSQVLGPEYPMYSFQAKGTDGHSAPQMLDEMVDHYINCIRLVQPKGPYVIGGYSFGGVPALEIARKLHEQGETIRQVIMFDTYPATQEVFDRHFGVYDSNFLEFYLANYSLKVHQNPHLAIRPEALAHLPQRLHLAELARMCKERGNRRVPVDDIYMYLRGGLACSEHAEGIYQMYQMKPYDASDVLFFKATDGFTGRASEMYWKHTDILKDYDYPGAWGQYMKRGFRVVELDNDHLNMLEEPTLGIAAREIEAVLKEPPAFDKDQYNRFQSGFGQVTRFGHELLADRFRNSGALPAVNERFTRSDLSEKLNVRPQYERLFEAAVDILEREGYVHRDGERLVVTEKLDSAEISGGESAISEKARALAANYPEIKDYLPLLTTCQAAFLEVMNGQRNATEVMFPGGSMTLVAELYKGNLQTDFYNRMVAEQVQDYVKNHLRCYKYSNVQLVEVGAGTGGTSTFVFDAIKDYGDRLRYLYTDVGPAFVQMSKMQFGKQYPFVDFMVLDVERPPDAQGFEPQSMDVIIAANVLHTTRRFDVTLEQCRRLLKPGGLLVINELTQRLDYNTLTFGLTPGWWVYEDEAERIQGAPLLLPGDWKRMLSRAGFAYIQIEGVPSVAAANQAQCVITARKIPAATPNGEGPIETGAELAIIDETVVC